MMRFWLSVVLCVAQLVLAGCAWRWPLMPAGLAGGGGDLTILREPRGIDWSSQLITSRSLGAQRQAFVEQQRAAYRALQAPVSPDGPAEGAGNSAEAQYNLQANWPQRFNNSWAVGGALGIPVASFSAGANHVPNSPATGLAGDAANKYLYLLSQNGHFMRVRGDDPLTATAAIVLTGETFSNTGITMSPGCSRAYVVSDTGRLFVIDAMGSPSMSVIASATLGQTANYITPFLDPLLSTHNESLDVLFVPDNSGRVNKFEFSGGALSGPTIYNIATGVLANNNCDGCGTFSSWRFAAPCVAIGGRVFIGDTAGNFYDYDTTANGGLGALRQLYGNLGTVGGIYTPPAIELYQDPLSPSESYRDTSNYDPFDDSILNRTSPVFAFVNVMRDVGPVCAWVNLAARTVTFSEPLFVDDNDMVVSASDFGRLVDYNYNASPTVTASAPFTAAVALAETGSIPGSGAATQTTPLAAARATDVIATYFSIDTDNASLLPASATINNARITLYTTTNTATGTANQPGFLRVGGWGADGSTGGRLRGGATWSPENISSVNAPVFLTTVPRVTNASDPITVTADMPIEWLGIEALLPGRMRTGVVGFKLDNASNTAYNTAAAPLFVGTGGGNAPFFAVDYEIRSNIPAYPIETAPIIDALNRRVFVYISNYVFCVQYGDQTDLSEENRWVGASGVAAENATYQATRLARSTGAREVGGAYVRNRISLAPSYNFSRLYAVSHGLLGTDYHVGISELTTTNFGTQENEDISPLLATNESDTLVAGTTPIASATGGRFMLIDPFSARAAGGDLLFTLEGTGRVYRVGTE